MPLAVCSSYGSRSSHFWADLALVPHGPVTISSRTGKHWATSRCLPTPVCLCSSLALFLGQDFLEVRLRLFTSKKLRVYVDQSGYEFSHCFLRRNFIYAK